MVEVSNQRYRWDFIGLSTDSKPTKATSNKVVNGSTFYESNTSKLYVWYGSQWYERLPLGGGGTSDFEDLTNRPQYNGTAMTGETNIPSVPTVVQTSGTSTTDVMSQKAVNDQFGGLALLSISQTDYDNLATKDPNTLYVITGA